jgi:hypothetical protein
VITIVSRHPGTGEGSLFLRLPPNWDGAGPAVELTGYREMFVLEGEADCADGGVLKTDYYAFIPPGHAHGFKGSGPGALIYVAFGPGG